MDIVIGVRDLDPEMLRSLIGHFGTCIGIGLVQGTVLHRSLASKAVAKPKEERSKD